MAIFDAQLEALQDRVASCNSLHVLRNSVLQDTCATFIEQYRCSGKMHLSRVRAGSESSPHTSSDEKTLSGLGPWYLEATSVPAAMH